MIHTRRVEHPLPLLDHRPGLVWLSPTVSIVGFGEAMRVAAGFGADRFERADEAFREWCPEVRDEVALPGSGAVAFSSFTFDGRSPGSVLIVPEIIFGRSGDTWFVTTVDGADPTPYCHPAGTAEAETDRPRYAGSSVPDVLWLEAVARAIERIDTSHLDKVVLARDFAVWSKRPFDSRLLLERLHARFPGCFTFLVDGLVGASPELLVRKAEDHIESVALAGSARRSADQQEDRRIGEALLQSDKDRREHDMAADSVAAVLRELCDGVIRDVEPALLELANVRHLATRFIARTSGPMSILDVVAKLHPTAAVGGWPTAAAVETIRELEMMDRGRYAGPVGWMDATGDGEFAIALRCAELSGARARLFAGAGIVRGSLPETELEETRLKLQAMLSALEP